MSRNPAQPQNHIARRAIALFAGIFGVMTVFAGGSVALRIGASRSLAGDIVPLVVWFNFAAGFAYLAAAVAIWTGRVWARPLAMAIAVATALVALGFAIAALTGHAFETRTIGALGFRFLVWTGIAVWLTSSARG